MRHAKSSWKDVNLADIDRPLNKRGERDAPFMGKLLYQNGFFPQEIISSPAERALSTAKLFCNEIKFPYKKVKINNSLYAASLNEILAVIKNLSENIESVLLIAHNPGLTDLVNYLSESRVENVPTCGIVELSSKKKSWQEIDAGSCKLGFLEYPKKHLKS